MTPNSVLGWPGVRHTVIHILFPLYVYPMRPIHPPDVLAATRWLWSSLLSALCSRLLSSLVCSCSSVTLICSPAVLIPCSYVLSAALLSSEIFTSHLYSTCHFVW